jgi:hypothetical protein
LERTQQFREDWDSQQSQRQILLQQNPKNKVDDGFDGIWDEGDNPDEAEMKMELRKKRY